MLKPNPPATAQELADHFQVSELEPRLENIWYPADKEVPREGWE